jgi:hypothetical protein
MLAKLCVLIVSLGIAAGVLLHLRQARLQAVHELAKAQLRMNARDRDLFRIRAEIAERITPERVEQMAQQFGPLTPLGVDAPDTVPQVTPATIDPAPAKPRRAPRASPRNAVAGLAPGTPEPGQEH